MENEWIKHTLRVWTKAKKMLGGPVSIWDSGFRRWADKGLSTINHYLMEQNSNHFPNFKNNLGSHQIICTDTSKYGTTSQAINKERWPVKTQNRRILY